MKSKWTGEYLAEAVRRHNAIADSLGRAVPRVAEVLDGARITGAKVDKRTREKVNAILAETFPGDAWARVYLQTEYNHALYLRADFNSPADVHSVNYADFPVRVAVPHNAEAVWRADAGAIPAPVTVSGVQAAFVAAEDAEEAARLARSAAADALNACGSFAE